MKYLAISKTPFYIAYAVFKERKLYEYGKVVLRETSEMKRLLEWENQVEELILKYRPTFLLTHLIDTNYVMKKDLVRLVEIKTILKRVSEKNKAIYMEYKTDGWEEKIIGRVTDLRKLTFINKGYELELDDVEIANAIILAEGVAHKRLQITND